MNQTKCKCSSNHKADCGYVESLCIVDFNPQVTQPIISNNESPDTLSIPSLVRLNWRQSTTSCKRNTYAKLQVKREQLSVQYLDFWRSHPFLKAAYLISPTLVSSLHS